MVNKQNNPDNEKSCGVRCEGEKYYCEDCDTEIQVDQDCPQCQRQVDWERAIAGVKRSV
jgi:hypothetical protein